VQYLCHSYTEEVGQLEEGTLYVKDPAVAKELKAAGLVYGDSTEAIDKYLGHAGLAETAEDNLGGEKFTISISMAKTLEAVGVQGTVTNAAVLFYYKNQFASLVFSKHKGDWYDKWKDTPEFEAFWRSTLGTKYAFICKGRGGNHE